MNLRILWQVFGNQRVWSRITRIRPFRNVNPFIRYGIGITKFPRTALFLSFTGVYSASPNLNDVHTKCSIDDAYLQELKNELIELERLKNTTLMCKKCNQRLLVDKPIDGKVYCKCDKNLAETDEKTGWQPFLESKDIIIWRREENPGSGLQEYKVYGRYEEVTAEDFLSMHTDLVYWKSWDDTALTIKKLPRLSKDKQNKNEEIIYWETLWPRFFSNRDYVYVKRHACMEIDYKTMPNQVRKHKDDDYGHKIEQYTHNNPENIRNTAEIGVFMKSHLFQEKKRNVTKIIVLTSQSCEHPDAPESRNAHRVKKYRSDLVIKPFTDLDKPGIEFSLTYFDDPGTSIPSALHSWVAGHACPDFLHKMRVAAANYKKFPQCPEVTNKMSITEESSNSNLEPTSNEKISPGKKENQSEAEDIKHHPKELSYEEKTRIETEEFLNLLNGKNNKSSGNSESGTNPTDRSSNSKKESNLEDPSTVDQSKEIRKEDQVESVVEKQKESNQQGMGYWQIWPLYYFA